MNEERTELVNLLTFLAVSCTGGHGEAAFLHFSAKVSLIREAVSALC